MQGHCVSGTIHLGDQGFQKISTGTHRFGTSRHLTENITFSESVKKDNGGGCGRGGEWGGEPGGALRRDGDQVDLADPHLDHPRPQHPPQPPPHWAPRLQAEPPLTHQQM